MKNKQHQKHPTNDGPLAVSGTDEHQWRKGRHWQQNPRRVRGNLNGRSGAGGRNPHAYNGTVCVDKPSPSHKHESTAYGTTKILASGGKAAKEREPGGRPVDQICNPLLRGGSRERRKDQLAAVGEEGGHHYLWHPVREAQKL